MKKRGFLLLFTSYKVVATEVTFVPIEFLDWECLAIGALGWGQIQIRNSNRIVINNGYSRRDWILTLCNVMLQFYPREILKIQERVTRFEDVQTYWKQKADVWA